MSHFYGTVQGSRGKATRQGGKSSGIRTNTACWAGTIFTHLSHDEDTDTDRVTIEVRGWPYGEYYAVVFNGTIQELTEAAKAGTLQAASVPTPVPTIEDIFEEHLGPLPTV